MNKIQKGLVNKLSNIEYNILEKKAKDLDEKINNKDHNGVEDILKEIPGFNMVEMINFGAYCRTEIPQKEWEEKTIEEHLIDWLEKI